MSTEMVDMLFLELSQFTGAKTALELHLEDENKRLRRLLQESLVHVNTASYNCFLGSNIEIALKGKE